MAFILRYTCSGCNTSVGLLRMVTRFWSSATIAAMSKQYLGDVLHGYNGRDRSRIQRLAERLREAGLRVGFEVWVVEPGDDIYAAVEQRYARSVASMIRRLTLAQAAFNSSNVLTSRYGITPEQPGHYARR